MGQEFEQLGKQDIHRFNSGSEFAEKREEYDRMRDKFLRGVSDLIAVVSEELPYIHRKKTTISPAPAGQLPESVRSEVARRAMRGESTQDIPRVAVESVVTEEEIKGVSKLRLHIFVPSTPSILCETNQIERILRFLKTTLSVTRKELEQAGDLLIEDLEIIPNLLKIGSGGVKLIKLDKRRVVEDYLDAAWSLMQKPPGIKNIDLDSELRHYLSGEIEQQSGQLDLMVVSGFGTIRSFCYSYRDHQRLPATFRRGRESSAANFSYVFGSYCPYLYFSAWQASYWTEDEGYGVIGDDGTVYTTETIEEYRGKR